jgi:hypothetical protein
MGILDDDDEDEDDVDVGSIRSHRRKPVAYGDDEDEDDVPKRKRRYNYDYDEELVELLQDIEQQRRRLHLNLKNLQALLAHDPELKARYLEFQRNGGITAAELERYLAYDLPLKRPRITYSRKHLRLVSSTNPVKRSRPRRRGGNDDDAA